MKCTLTARVKEIGEVVKRGDYEYLPVIVTEEDEKYPQTFDLEIAKGKESFKENISVGDEVEFHLDIRGRSWMNSAGKLLYFKTFNAWKWTRVSVDHVKSEAEIFPEYYKPPKEDKMPQGPKTDDLPF